MCQRGLAEVLRGPVTVLRQITDILYFITTRMKEVHLGPSNGINIALELLSTAHHQHVCSPCCQDGYRSWSSGPRKSHRMVGGKGVIRNGPPLSGHCDRHSGGFSVNGQCGVESFVSHCKTKAPRWTMSPPARPTSGFISWSESSSRKSYRR